MRQTLNSDMRRQSMSQRPKDEEIEQLLVHLRGQVAHLRRLEQVSSDESDLNINRRTIAELQWRLAKLAHSAAA
jgi:hypothetical protein